MFWSALTGASSKLHQESEAAYHHIPTTGSPVRVPPQCVPVQYCEEVEQQIQDMLDIGIIMKSNSPWMAPAEFVWKKSVR